VVTLAKVIRNVVRSTVKAESVALWIVKPVSFVALSIQVRVTVGVVGAGADGVAVRFAGAAGGVASVVIVYSFDGKELPAAL